MRSEAGALVSSTLNEAELSSRHALRDCNEAAKETPTLSKRLIMKPIRHRKTLHESSSVLSISEALPCFESSSPAVCQAESKFSKEEVAEICAMARAELEQEVAKIKATSYSKKVVDETFAKIRSEFVCPICQAPAKLAVSLGCAHYMCQGCITLFDNHIDSMPDRSVRLTNRKCPQCKSRISGQGNIQPGIRNALHHIDEFEEKKSLQLPTFCTRTDLQAQKHALQLSCYAHQLIASSAYKNVCVFFCCNSFHFLTYSLFFLQIKEAVGVRGFNAGFYIVFHQAISRAFFEELLRLIQSDQGRSERPICYIAIDMAQKLIAVQHWNPQPLSESEKKLLQREDFKILPQSFLLPNTSLCLYMQTNGTFFLHRMNLQFNRVPTDFQLIALNGLPSLHQYGERNPLPNFYPDQPTHHQHQQQQQQQQPLPQSPPPVALPNVQPNSNFNPN